MAYDIGDVVPLQVTVADATGTPANATTVTLTLTLPDGTAVTGTSSGTVTNPAPGVYQFNYPVVQAGRHRVSWAATGANASAFSDVFDAYPTDPGYLFSLADARAICRTAANDTSNDELLRTYIAAVTLVVEYLCGKQIKTSVTQTYNGGAAGIVLPSNLISVDTVIENTLTLTPNLDYTVDLRSCIVYRGSPLAVFSFVPGIQNITVTFTKGNVVIPANVLMGAELILRHFWQGTQQGPIRASFSEPDTAVSQTTNVLGYLIPNVAMTFLKASPAMPGFA